MDEEIRCIENNQTWNLVDVLKDKDFISVKSIYKTKQYAEGNLQKYNARLVARGFT
jgi:hypothetical protein